MVDVVLAELGLSRAIVVCGWDLDWNRDERPVLRVEVRDRVRRRGRCGRCGEGAAWYDRGGGRRMWRHLDVAFTRVATKKALDEFSARDLSGLRVAVLMVDGIDFAGECRVAALATTTDGTKVPVGLRQGDAENKTVVTDLLPDLVERGLDASVGHFCVIDGAKAGPECL